MHITKSDCMRGCQCVKALWLSKHRSELLQGKLSEMKLALFRQGQEVGEWARKAYPGGTLIEGRDAVKALEATKSCTTDVIFEAAIGFEDLFIRVDILKKVDGGYELIEVKSSSSVKDEHLVDVAFQRYVCEKAGYHITKAYVMFLNAEYERKGPIDPVELFTLTDVTAALQDVLIENKITEFRTSLKTQDEPDISIGPHCTKPHECNYMGYCWKDVPQDSIYNVRPPFRREQLVELRNNRVDSMFDIPQEFELNPKQQMFIALAKKGKRIIETDGLKKFLEKLTFPITHMDFETVRAPIPMYEGFHPYEQLPFQYSLHIEEGDSIVHKEYLCAQDKDCREELLATLLTDLPETGTILAYNASFERSVIGELSELYPKYKKKAQSVIKRIVDLREPFAKNLFQDPTFRGSTSLKIVLPALVPDMSYDDMDVYEGGLASLAYVEMIHGKTERRAQLLAYCKQDTLAMVKVLGVLKSSA